MAFLKKSDTTKKFVYECLLGDGNFYKKTIIPEIVIIASILISSFVYCHLAFNGVIEEDLEPYSYFFFFILCVISFFCFWYKLNFNKCFFTVDSKGIFIEKQFERYFISRDNIENIWVTHVSRIVEEGFLSPYNRKTGKIVNKILFYNIFIKTKIALFKNNSEDMNIVNTGISFNGECAKENCFNLINEFNEFLKLDTKCFSEPYKQQEEQISIPSSVSNVNNIRQINNNLADIFNYVDNRTK